MRWFRRVCPAGERVEHYSRAHVQPERYEQYSLEWVVRNEDLAMDVALSDAQHEVFSLQYFALNPTAPTQYSIGIPLE